jgi:vanillate monooxygenase ferredoxin subunit
MSQSWKTVRVAAKTREADDITSFELVDPQAAPLQSFSAGSHIDVEVTTGLIRQYSLCNDPRESHRYLIGVLRQPASRGGSVTLIDTVEAGAELRISEPRNHFALDPRAERVLLLAGGIGITPMLCMAERLAHIGTPFELHYSARSRSRAAFYDRIAGSPFTEKVHFHFDDRPGTRLDLAKLLGDRGARDHLYVCGPKGFIEAVLATALAAGWPPDQLHREFFAPVEDAKRSGDGAFEVEVASTGARLYIAAGQTVIDVLSANGFDIPVSCEQGVCGTCVTRVLKGTPDHRDMFMTDQEHARNDQFTPCCSRSKTDLLVLDL